MSSLLSFEVWKEAGHHTSLFALESMPAGFLAGKMVTILGLLPVNSLAASSAFGVGCVLGTISVAITISKLFRGHPTLQMIMKIFLRALTLTAMVATYVAVSALTFKASLAVNGGLAVCNLLLGLPSLIEWLKKLDNNVGRFLNGVDKTQQSRVQQ